MNYPSVKSLLLGGLGLSSLSAFSQERPNILFIMSDDHSAQAISCYDGTLNQTPQIDQLARKGVRFTNCFCTNAISGPSRATILTGTFNHINGQLNNSTSFDTAQLSLPKVLRSNGYQTAIIGKWHLKTSPSGFDYWNILPGQGDYYNPNFIDNGKKVQRIGYVSDIITQDAIHWLDKRNTEEPFFLMVHHKAPHRNWMPRLDLIEKYWNTTFPLPDNFHQDYSTNDVLQAQKMSIAKDMLPAYDLKILHPDSMHALEARYMGLERMRDQDRKRFMDLYKKRYQNYQKVKDDPKKSAELKYQWYMQDYLACVASVDQSVGEIMGYLKENDLDQNTIVVYTSDQGFFLGQHGWFDKRFMYEESLRMPLIVYDPRLPDQHQVRNQLIMNVDFAPTLLELAGINIPMHMQGTSFAKQLSDSSIAGRKSVYYHYFEFPGPHSVPRHYGVRTDRYKLMHFYHGANRWELYDLKNDPSEMHSLYNDPAYKEIQRNMHDLLEENRTLFKDTIRFAPDLTQTIINGANVKKQVFVNKPHVKYQAGGYDALYDKKIENLSPFSESVFDSWLGFNGEDLNVHWILQKPQVYDTVEVWVLKDEASWIFAPTTVTLYVNENEDGQYNLPKAKTKTIPRSGGGEIIVYTFAVEKAEINTLRVVAENRGICPDNHPGRGQKAWLFVEEIILK